MEVEDKEEVPTILQSNVFTVFFSFNARDDMFIDQLR